MNADVRENRLRALAVGMVESPHSAKGDLYLCSRDDEILIVPELSASEFN